MNLYIKKRPLPTNLAMYIFIMPFLLSFFQNVLHLPSLIKYTIDVAWVLIAFWSLIKRRQLIHKKVVPFAVFIIIYLLYVFIGYIFNFQSAIYFLWGFRNNFRFYIAFIAFISFLNKDDVKVCLKYVDVLFVINAIVTFFQFFVLGYKWDYLGGVFGVEVGCNGSSMILLIFVCIKSIISYMNSEEKLVSCLTKCSVSMIIAAMAELKFFFIIFVSIVVLATVFTSFSWKKVSIIILAAAIFFASSIIFTQIWGASSELNINRLVELVTNTNYASSKDLGRLTAIPILSKTILKSLPEKLFGLGLGNCDTSSFAICNTPFYQSHSYLNYNWISSAFVFLEMGYLGVTIYLAFFVLVFIMAGNMKRKGEGNLMYCQMSMIMSVACVLLFMYNSSLRMDVGYVAYFVLALPFISTTSESMMKSIWENEKKGL